MFNRLEGLLAVRRRWMRRFKWSLNVAPRHRRCAKGATISSAIQTVRNGIIQHGVRQPGGGMVGFQGAADLRRRNGDLDVVDVIKLDAGRRLVDVAGTRDHQETNAAHHVAPPMPGADLGEGVGADEEVQLVRRGETGAYLLYGIDGVTARRVFLEAGDFEARVGLAGEFCHADTIGIRRVSSLWYRWSNCAPCLPRGGRLRSAVTPSIP